MTLPRKLLTNERKHWEVPAGPVKTHPDPYEGAQITQDPTALMKLHRWRPRAASFPVWNEGIPWTRTEGNNGALRDAVTLNVWTTDRVIPHRPVKRHLVKSTLWAVYYHKTTNTFHQMKIYKNISRGVRKEIHQMWWRIWTEPYSFQWCNFVIYIFV